MLIQGWPWLSTVPRPLRGICAVEVDAAVVAEAARRPAGLGIHRQQVAVGGAVEDPRLVAVGPVGQAADAVAARVDGESRAAHHVRVVNPLHGAGPRVERRGEPERGHDVDHTVHHQRCGLHVEDAQVFMNLAQGVEVERLVGRAPAPGDLQVVEVARVDLIEARVLRAAQVATVSGPLAVGRAVLRGGGRGHGGEQRAGDHDGEEREPSESGIGTRGRGFSGVTCHCNPPGIEPASVACVRRRFLTACVAWRALEADVDPVCALQSGLRNEKEPRGVRGSPKSGGNRRSVMGLRRRSFAPAKLPTRPFGRAIAAPTPRRLSSLPSPWRPRDPAAPAPSCRSCTA